MKANIIFSGGGIKGIGLLGALAAADERGYVWEKVAGTSVGALLASLVASGYAAQEIYDLIAGFDFKQLLDGDFEKLLPTLGMFTNIILEQGVYRGRALENWVKSLLAAKGVSTFADLKPGRLTLIASDLTLNKMLILPDDLAQYGLAANEFPVAKAVRMSASLPLFFEPVLLKYKKTASYVVDGGLLSNFPIWLFHNDPNPTFGFCFQGDNQSQKAKDLWSYLEAIVNTAISGHDRRALSKTDARIIAVPTLGISTTNFNLTARQMQRLYQAGKKAAEDYFLGNEAQFLR